MRTKFMLGTGFVLTSLLVSCSSEDLLQGGKPENANTLRAYIEKQSDSRVTIDDEGIFAWSNDDAISVQSGSDFSTWTLSSINEDGSADFSSDDEAEDGAYAIYPNTVEAKVSTNDELQVTLPASYDTNKTAPILFGKYVKDSNKVNFSHVGSLMRIKLANVPDEAVSLTFKATGSKIAGDFSIADYAISTETTTDTNDQIKIAFSSNDVTDGNITFDIPLPVGDYSSFGFDLNNSTGSIVSKTSSSTNTYAVARGELLSMPTIVLFPYTGGCGYMYSNKAIDTKVGDGVITFVKAKDSDLSTIETCVFYNGNENTLSFAAGSSLKIQDSKSYAIKIVAEGDEDSSDEEAAESYILETIVPTTTSYAVGILGYSGGMSSGYDVSQVKAIYLDGEQIDNANSYKFSDTNEHTLKIVMNDSFNTAYEMFSGCSSITTLDLSHLDTSNISDMSSMFNDCTSLETLTLTGLNTASVTNMNSMFRNCPKLTTLDLSSFDTKKVTNMSNMFIYCTALEKLDLTSFETDELTTMAYMFMGCTSLESVDLSSFKGEKLTSLEYTFGDCSALKSIDLLSLDTSNVTTIRDLFYRDTKLSTIKMNVNIANASNFENAFYNVASKGTIYFPEKYREDYVNKVYTPYLTDWEYVSLDDSGNVVTSYGHEVDSVEED